MAKIGSVETGKIGELLVVTELLKRGASVFLPVADQGIDAIVRSKDGQLSEIQVKTTVSEDQAGWFNVDDLELQSPDGFIVVGIDMLVEPHEFWIIPAGVFMEFATKSKTKQGYVQYRLGLEARSRAHDNRPRRYAERLRFR